jgi:hypothetical protein
MIQKVVILCLLYLEHAQKGIKHRYQEEIPVNFFNNWNRTAAEVPWHRERLTMDKDVALSCLILVNRFINDTWIASKYTPPTYELKLMGVAMIYLGRSSTLRKCDWTLLDDTWLVNRTQENRLKLIEWTFTFLTKAIVRVKTMESCIESIQNRSNKR